MLCSLAFSRIMDPAALGFKPPEGTPRTLTSRHPGLIISAMLAIKLHKTLRPRLVKDAFLVPIVDWRSGRRQVRNWLRWRSCRYISLVRIPDDHPVSIRFTYGESNFIKEVAWPTEFRPLRDWPRDYVRAIGLWWNAYGRRGATTVESGGLLIEEPRLFLGRKLPDANILWTKELRLLYGKPPARSAVRLEKR